MEKFIKFLQGMSRPPCRHLRVKYRNGAVSCWAYSAKFVNNINYYCDHAKYNCKYGSCDFKQILQYSKFCKNNRFYKIRIVKINNPKARYRFSRAGLCKIVCLFEVPDNICGILEL